MILKANRILLFLSVIAGLLLPISAHADASGDITSIWSDQAGGVYTQAGQQIEFKIALDGHFVLTNTYGGTLAAMPEVRITVNGEMSSATLSSVSQYTIDGGLKRTAAHFRYAIKPGDMAQPLRLFGTGLTQYQFLWNGWEVRNSAEGRVAVWRFNVALYRPDLGEANDLDLAKANITIRSLRFDEEASPTTLTSGETSTWRVVTEGLAPAGKGVNFYVWTLGTNTVQIGATPGQTALWVSMPEGVAEQEVPLVGLAAGTTEVYLQRIQDFENNATQGVTNYIRRALTVSLPPQPVAAPIFAPGSSAQGTNYVDVTAQCPTEGAALRYTLDGTEPTAESPLFPGVLRLTQSGEVKAKAFKAGMIDSDTVTASYTIVVPEFDIVDVRILCKERDGTYSASRFQPLVSDDVGLEARVDNLRLMPSNIQLYVTYYVGTNVWGTSNWPTGRTTTLPMYPTAENPLVYRTSPGADIPVQEQDQVVQYCVWASYLGAEIPRVKAQDTFENPAWYFPVDLNRTFQTQGWSPYYVVYGVPQGAIWINEINAIDYVQKDGTRQYGLWDNCYIEIAVPAGVDLAGWTIDCVNYDYRTAQTIRIPNGLPSERASTNGYAFYVIGDAEQPPEVPALPVVDCAIPGLSLSIPLVLPGGLRLRRPLGMYEQAIAYNFEDSWGDLYSGRYWAENDPERQHVYIGLEREGGSLSRIGETDSTNTWIFPATWTPGWANEGQVVPNASERLQGVLAVSTPVFTPASGTVATNAIDVSISTATAGATVHYTLDGSEPSTESPVWSGAITLTRSGTVKAKAFKPGWLTSTTAVAEYAVVLPVFDLGDVKVLCCESNGTYSAVRTQPLSTDRVGVQARVANAQLSPSNILMFVSYYVGTNVWGVDNWPTDQVVVKPMYPSAEDPMLFRTSPADDISPQAPDQVVQYRVWATYWVGGVFRCKHQDTTEKPPLFFQVDLNEVFASQGWSPYYIVYGPRGPASWPLDIVSITSDQANGVCSASGEAVDIKIVLAGRFLLANVAGATYAHMPEIRIAVGEEEAYAELTALNLYQAASGGGDRTELVFRYTVRTGDMAQPLMIFGPPDLPYEFVWNGWEIRSESEARAAVWKFNTGLSLASEGEVCDLDLAGANVAVQTLSFDESSSPSTLQARNMASWRVESVNPVEASPVDFYVWTPATNLVQVGSESNQAALLLSMTNGATQVDVPIKALNPGTAEIILQRVKDYQNNTLSGVTNAVRRTLTILPPPPPSLSVTFTDTGTSQLTMNESADPDTGSFEVRLSEAFTNDVWVRMEAAPYGQSNVSFDTTPFVVRIPAGSRVSSASLFSVPDGTEYSAYYGVTLTPVITNVEAAAFFTQVQSATVYVRNIPPEIRQPSNTVRRTAQKNMPITFDWEISDSIGDVSAGITVMWDFDDGTRTQQTVHEKRGQMSHTYALARPRLVQMCVCDKDYARPAVRDIYVDVLPTAVMVVPSAATYSESAATNTGSLMVYLSAAYTNDVWVRLTPSLNGGAQSSVALSADMVCIPQGCTNSQAPVTFSLLDGTSRSEYWGIDIVPSVTNAPAAAVFTDLQPARIYVTNQAPKITFPANSFPTGTVFQAVIGRPLTFDYAVEDAPADRDSMLVYLNSSVCATGAVGKITRIFNSEGHFFFTLEARDKDGGRSQYIWVEIKVNPVPPPPSVSVLTPTRALAESDLSTTNEVMVKLSEAFTNRLVVGLSVSPVSTALNGGIALATNQVEFASGETEKKVRITGCDGTALSLTNGFTIHPTVLCSQDAAAYYTVMTPGTVTVSNVSPVIQYPLASDASAPAVFVLRKGDPWGFNWAASDVAKDLSSLRVRWDFGDGTTQALAGASGFVAHMYEAVGDMRVRVVAEDKDGADAEVAFSVRVLPATGGFVNWAERHGLEGDVESFFAADSDSDGVANGIEYAFGGNLTNGVPLMVLKFVGDQPVVETPCRDPNSTVDAAVTVEACTNLLSGGWTVPMGPCAHVDKPADRDWYAPLTTVPKATFFRLRAILD